MRSKGGSNKGPNSAQSLFLYILSGHLKETNKHVLSPKTLCCVFFHSPLFYIERVMVKVQLFCTFNVASEHNMFIFQCSYYEVCKFLCSLNLSRYSKSKVWNILEDRSFIWKLRPHSSMLPYPTPLYIYYNASILGASVILEKTWPFQRVYVSTPLRKIL